MPRLPRGALRGWIVGTLARLKGMVGSLGSVWALAYWLQVSNGPLPVATGLGRSLLLNLLALLVSCGLVAWAAWHINRPVEALHEAAGRLRDGDLDPRLDGQRSPIPT